MPYELAPRDTSAGIGGRLPSIYPHLVEVEYPPLGGAANTLVLQARCDYDPSDISSAVAPNRRKKHGNDLFLPSCRAVRSLAATKDGDPRAKCGRLRKQTPCRSGGPVPATGARSSLRPRLAGHFVPLTPRGLRRIVHGGGKQQSYSLFNDGQSVWVYFVELARTIPRNVGRKR